MQNEIEKLMRPRYEVIAPYPFSPYKVGDIIEKIAKLNWQVKQRPVSCLSEDDPYAQYPHLFREMEWWEGVAESEMPKYLKNKFSSQVLEVDRYHFNESKQAFVYFKNREFVEYLGEYSPATEAEYKGEGK